MTIRTGTFTEPQTKGHLLNQAGMAPDPKDHPSTLGEVLQRGGFIAIDEVIDLLPFRIRTLRKWARKGPFARCFKRMHIGPCGNSILLINVSLFATRFEELAEVALVKDSKEGLPLNPSMTETGGLDGFAKLVFGSTHL